MMYKFYFVLDYADRAFHTTINASFPTPHAYGTITITHVSEGGEID